MRRSLSLPLSRTMMAKTAAAFAIILRLWLLSLLWDDCCRHHRLGDNNDVIIARGASPLRSISGNSHGDGNDDSVDSLMKSLFAAWTSSDTPTTAPSYLGDQSGNAPLLLAWLDLLPRTLDTRSRTTPGFKSIFSPGPG